MKVFTKYLLKSITEKKGRTLLLLTSIAISAALLVASMGSVKALLGTFSTQVKGNYGDFNVQIIQTPGGETPLFKPVDNSVSGIKSNIKIAEIGGYLSKDSEKEFSLEGTTLEDFKKLSSMELIKKENLEPFTGNKIIISKRISDSLKVKLGEELKLNILGKEESYKVAAIASDKGIFFSDKEDKFSLVTPEENVFSIYGEKNKYSFQLAAVDSKDLAGWVKKFNENNKVNKIQAAQVFDEKAIEQQLNTIKMPLYFMLGIVLIMTTFIIYSSFKLIITERMSVIGVFLSQGATKFGIMRILLRESLAYGILGGILGDFIGAGLTYLISYLVNPLKAYGVKATTEFYAPYFVAGFIFALLLSMASTLIPILSIRKLPVKDVILNTLGTSSKISMKSFLGGIVLIVVSVAIHFTVAKTGSVASVAELFLAFIGVILIIPKIVDMVVYPIVKIFRNINGLSMLSFNNIRTSKVLINNMRLIAVAVISIVMINSMALSMKNIVQGAYDSMNFDVTINVNSDYSKNIYNIVKDYKSIKEVSYMGGVAAKLNGEDSKLLYINYVDPIKYKNFESYTAFDNKNKELEALNSDEDGIIVSTQIAKRYKINKGDTITLNTENKKEQLKVLSIFNAKLMDSGNYNLISLKAAAKHFDYKYPSQYYINTSISANEAKTQLSKALKGLGAKVITKEEMNKTNIESNKQVTDILSIFSYITMVIGAFGIIGNVSISFIQRKREIAVMSSVGLSKGARGFMIVLESLFQALIGSAISLIAALGINVCLTDIFKFLDMDMDLTYPVKSIATIVIATMILMLLTSLASIFKSRKLKIVQELKYE